MPTDTTEKGLETLIMRHMTGGDGFFPDGGPNLQEPPAEIAAGKAGGSGWVTSHPGRPLLMPSLTFMRASHTTLSDSSAQP